MNGRVATAVGLVFAVLWWWIGANTLVRPWSTIVGATGTAGLAMIGWQAWRRGGDGRQRFDRSRYRMAVLGEMAGLVMVGWLVSDRGMQAYLWPAIGIVVGLHFIGLYWASGKRRFLVLSGTMTAINLGALALPPGLATGIAGFGSAALLATTVGWP